VANVFLKKILSRDIVGIKIFI